ncbi:MAG: hypothetical protein EBY29_11425 [Planctomycetes bacterium]|nr:hypothetical protein [Planctomycetota bacterium]
MGKAQVADATQKILFQDLRARWVGSFLRKCILRCEDRDQQRAERNVDAQIRHGLSDLVWCV